MMIFKIPSQLAHALPSARLRINSVISSMIDALRPRMVLIPVSQHRGSTCGQAISANAGIKVHAMVRPYADLVTKEWQMFNFGKTNAGDTTGHSQPSRFAP